MTCAGHSPVAELFSYRRSARFLLLAHAGRRKNRTIRVVLAYFFPNIVGRSVKDTPRRGGVAQDPSLSSAMISIAIAYLWCRSAPTFQTPPGSGRSQIFVPRHFSLFSKSVRSFSKGPYSGQTARSANWGLVFGARSRGASHLVQPRRPIIPFVSALTKRKGAGGRICSTTSSCGRLGLLRQTNRPCARVAL